MSEFELKKQIGKKGFYCKIGYEIEIVDFKYQKTNFDIQDEWYSAVLFASRYFFDKFTLYKDRGFKLKIHFIHSMIIDTTPMVVFYAIIMLLTKETGYVITDFAFDDNGNLILPK